ncbi:MULTISPECIES: glycosyltransferase [unclassified Prochlorococcus]|uniref:glycosyltransferase family protein n=1 Tax=Prochlorococcus sp. MIT 0703 TaxID=1499504 RepID=UPI000AD76B91
MFLTGRKDPEVWPLTGVEVRRFELHREVSSEIHPYLIPMEQAVLQGQAVLRVLDVLAQEGFQPRLTFAHGGNGLSLFIRHLFPETRLIAYMEWWFRDETSHWCFPSYEFDQRLRTTMRNSIILQELEQCDVAVTPTSWQQQQFPKHYKDKIKVIFDGVDTSFFCPTPVKGELILNGLKCVQPLHIGENSLLLTYATRGMETLRGFPEFMRMLPPLLEALPNLEVVIAGDDRCVYSQAPDRADGSWKQALLEELGNRLDLGRVHFTGSLMYGEYQQMLNRSDLHVYFTRSYVTSWGLFQAAACGASLMVNRDPATNYVLKGDQAYWVDLDDPQHLVDCATKVLKSAPERRKNIKQSYLKSEWALGNCIASWVELINAQLKV